MRSSTTLGWLGCTTRSIRIAVTVTSTRRSPRNWGVFELRDPARRAWEQWTPALTHVAVDVAGIGVVESWEEVTTVDGDLVTFRSMTNFTVENLLLESVSTLRFRERSAVEASLVAARFELPKVRHAPDRPGREFVFLARRPLAD